MSFFCACWCSCFAEGWCSRDASVALTRDCLGPGESPYHWRCGPGHYWSPWMSSRVRGTMFSAGRDDGVQSADSATCS